MQSVNQVLKAVKKGTLNLKKAESILKLDAIASVENIARIDYKRYLRRGVPEIIYARNKSAKQIQQILVELIPKWERSPSPFPIILSKVKEDQINVIVRTLRHFKKLRLKYFESASMVVIGHLRSSSFKGKAGRVALLAAGTSDISALNEAEVVLNFFGCRTLRYNDVGVAGLHRLAEPLKKITSFNPDAIIVAAGMEGALASVVAGLSSVPIIGLPTSVGYGYGGNGEAALMSMLQACSLGVCVVNIDAGVAAGVVAWLISRRGTRPH